MGNDLYKWSQSKFNISPFHLYIEVHTIFSGDNIYGKYKLTVPVYSSDVSTVLEIWLKTRKKQTGLKTNTKPD